MSLVSFSYLAPLLFFFFVLLVSFVQVTPQMGKLDWWLGELNPLQGSIFLVVPSPPVPERCLDIIRWFSEIVSI